MKNEIKSTAHSKYRCQYHIVFAPKYRRKESPVHATKALLPKKILE